MILWSSEHKLGGSIDLVIKNSDNSLSLYDWKRAKDKISKDENNWGRYGEGPLSVLPDTKYNKYTMQLNLYRELLERFYGYSVKSMHIVRLHPAASSFELTPVQRMDKITNELLRCRHAVVQSSGTATSNTDAEISLTEQLGNLDIN